MVSVAQHDLTSQIFQLIRSQALQSPLRSDRHKYRGVDDLIAIRFLRFLRALQLTFGRELANDHHILTWWGKWILETLALVVVHLASTSKTSAGPF